MLVQEKQLDQQIQFYKFQQLLNGYQNYILLLCKPLQGNFDTPTYLINQGTSSLVATKSFSELQAHFKTNILAFNQSRYFQKNAVSLTEAQIEINGIPVYPFPQTPALIKNKNLEALDLEGNIYANFSKISFCVIA